MRKMRFLALLLALCTLLSVTALAADDPKPTAEPEPTAEPVEGPSWEEVSRGVKVWKNSIGTLWVHAWVEIRNNGTEPLYLSSTSLDIENADGDLLQTLKNVSGYPQVLMPGEVGVYDECTLADDELPEKGLTVTGRLKIEQSKVECIRYDITGFKVKTDKYKQTTGKGRVENNTEDPADGFIYACALCYNAKGNYIGLLYTIVTDEIPAGERQGFETMSASWKVKDKDIAETITYAYPQQYQF